MALSAKERQRRRMEKLRQDPEAFELFKKKRAQSSKKCLAKKKEREKALPQAEQKKLLAKKRKDTRNRVNKHRVSKKERLAAVMEARRNPESPPFKSASALGKATAKAKRALLVNLPHSPRRRSAVRRQIVQTEFRAEATAALSPNQRPGPNALESETFELVIQFYERDDISRQAPGRKDAIPVQSNDGTKEQKQIKHLTLSISEVYSLFCKEYPTTQIGKSKFAYLRPKHVLLSSKLPHNVCMCQYHENFIMAVNALHKVCPDVPKYSYDFPGTCVCDPLKEDCWMNNCESCKDAQGFQSAHPLNEILPATWHVWTKQGGRLTKVEEEETTAELYQHICSLIPKFLKHCYTKRQQEHMYNEDRSNAVANSDPVNALLQLDFSENYTCVSQDEIQSAHWNQFQVSLLTSSLWYDGTQHPIILASDNNDHSKETIIPYLSSLLKSLPPHIKTISIWSDGPSSQFKNSFIAKAIILLQKIHNMEIRWNYFATSHGKGPVDGIGGAVKRKVFNEVKKRKHIVKDAASFVAAAEGSSVQVVEMKSSDIDDISSSLKLAEVFNETATIPGISDAHCIRIIDGRIVIFNFTKDAINDVNVHVTPSSSSSTQATPPDDLTTDVQDVPSSSSASGKWPSEMSQNSYNCRFS